MSSIETCVSVVVVLEVVVVVAVGADSRGFRSWSGGSATRGSVWVLQVVFWTLAAMA